MVNVYYAIIRATLDEVIKQENTVSTNYNDVRHNLITMLEELDERLTTITQDNLHAEKDFEGQTTQNKNNEVQDDGRIELLSEFN